MYAVDIAKEIGRMVVKKSGSKRIDDDNNSCISMLYFVIRKKYLTICDIHTNDVKIILARIVVKNNDTVILFNNILIY